MNYPRLYLDAVSTIAKNIDLSAIEDMINILVDIRKINGRLFILGVGGSAANCSHAVNDFRKLAGIDAHAPTDNVSELTARTNDEGWESVFTGYLNVSRLNQNDCLLILSVGGGDESRGVSVNLIRAMEMAQSRGARIIALVGRDGGIAAKMADSAVVIPVIYPDMITPLSEAWQSVVWHLMVSDPRLLAKENKWEGLAREETIAAGANK